MLARACVRARSFVRARRCFGGHSFVCTALACQLNPPIHRRETQARTELVRAVSFFASPQNVLGARTAWGRRRHSLATTQIKSSKSKSSSKQERKASVSREGGMQRAHGASTSSSAGKGGGARARPTPLPSRHMPLPSPTASKQVHVVVRHRPEQDECQQQRRAERLAKQEAEPAGVCVCVRLCVCVCHTQRDAFGLRSDECFRRTAHAHMTQPRRTSTGGSASRGRRP